MNQEVLEEVMKEILEELKFQREDRVKHGQMLREMYGEIQGLTDKLAKQRSDRLQHQMDTIKGDIEMKLGQLADILRSYPAHTKQVRILLFPEYDTIRYYKLVFGRMMMWTMVALALTYLYLLAKGYL
jgi:hypothetical protein